MGARVQAGDTAGRKAQAFPVRPHDQRVEPEVRHRPLDLVDAIGMVEWAAAARTEHGATSWQHPTHHLDRERHRATFADAVPGVEESDEFVAVEALALPHRRPDDGVETGTVASSGEHPYAHDSRSYDRAASTANVATPSGAPTGPGDADRCRTRPACGDRTGSW